MKVFLVTLVNKKVGKPYNAADARMLIFLNVVEGLSGLSLYGGGHWW